MLTAGCGDVVHLSPSQGVREGGGVIEGGCGFPDRELYDGVSGATHVVVGELEGEIWVHLQWVGWLSVVTNILQ